VAQGVLLVFKSQYQKKKKKKATKKNKGYSLLSEGEMIIDNARL
jgi:hypothetical protein